MGTYYYCYYYPRFVCDSRTLDFSSTLSGSDLNRFHPRGNSFDGRSRYIPWHSPMAINGNGSRETQN